MSRKSETLQSLSYFNRSALKSPRSTTVLFSPERLSKRFGRKWLLNSESYIERCLYRKPMIILLKLFGLIHLEVFSKFIIYSFFNIKQDFPILLHSIGVYSILYPCSWIEIKGFWFSFRWDSDTPRKSKFKLSWEISFESSPKWNGSQEMFKWKEYVCLCC